MSSLCNGKAEVGHLADDSRAQNRLENPTLNCKTPPRVLSFTFFLFENWRHNFLVLAAI
jgi:hypothetical protein